MDRHTEKISGSDHVVRGNAAARLVAEWAEAAGWSQATDHNGCRSTVENLAVRIAGSAEAWDGITLIRAEQELKVTIPQLGDRTFTYRMYSSRRLRTS
ncbi:hypothetical protein [Streptomyces sp. NRRL B-24484]|uniref:hypothetical protein n=1 Tax=Streptomyces sp. NRRL B-24484 TaxID=1463833 RepID=UPI0004BEF63A|nr:hypothetical protein [Streptomyces sp. NRRL B-24484]